MRVALVVVFVSVLTTSSEASQSCMSKTEARQSFHSSYIYWHGVDHCWDAIPIRRYRSPHRAHHHEPEPTPPAVMPMPSPDLRRSANAMAVDESETDLIRATPWEERWTDITPVASPQFVVAIPKPEPMVTPRGMVMVIITIILTIAIVEVLFGGMINERMHKRRHRGFAR
jgi:hypothetical protein